MVKVFIDGAAGTTGLRIHDRLSERADIELLTLPEELRKDAAARKQAMNQADIVFLCLPDAAAIEAVELIENENVKVIDTSTAHRVAPGWTYGFPEIVGRDAVLNAKRLANPGCHASGFVALVYPLVKAGLISKDTALTCFSLTGYSGGGKKMIADYESGGRDPLLKGPRQYGLTQKHKHLPEMQIITGLNIAPVFCPIVADFYSGMEVTVPVFGKDLKGSPEAVRAAYADFYGTDDKSIVYFAQNAGEGGFMSAAALSGKDSMEITVGGNEERILLTARFDNLGKGASGAAIQNMNIMTGMPETAGLVL